MCRLDQVGVLFSTTPRSYRPNGTLTTSGRAYGVCYLIGSITTSQSAGSTALSGALPGATARSGTKRKYGSDWKGRVIDRGRVTSVDASKVDDALEVTELSESDGYEIEESEYVRTAGVDEEYIARILLFVASRRCCEKPVWWVRASITLRDVSGLAGVILDVEFLVKEFCPLLFGDRVLTLAVTGYFEERFGSERFVSSVSHHRYQHPVGERRIGR
jgi:hypothetical protein